MDWLADSEVQKTITFFASIFTIVAGIIAGGWALYKHFRGSRQKTPPIQAITADRGGVAAGRDAYVTRESGSHKRKS